MTEGGMRNLIRPGIVLARSALYGYLLAFLMIVLGIVLLSVIGLLAGVSRLTIGIGPVPVMSFWSSSAGNGFQSEWGVPVLACLGAAIGAAVALRRQHAAA
jgi:hypothetical protein